MFRSGRNDGRPLNPRTSSADRNRLPSIRPPFARAPYILASPRAVMTPLTDGISLSRNGISPCTKDFAPGKYIEPNPPENHSAAYLGARKLNTGFARLLWGIRICAHWVGAFAGGRPRDKPSVLSGRAISVGI